MEKVEEIKYKVLELINKKKEVKIPKMGFTDYYVHQQLHHQQQQNHHHHHHHQQPQQQQQQQHHLQRFAMSSVSSSGTSVASTKSAYDWANELTNEEEPDAVDGSVPQEKLSDQELLEATEAIYFDAGSNSGLHELRRLSAEDRLLDGPSVVQRMSVLKRQHRVISKKVLQLILEQRVACDAEFERIRETERMLRDTASTCREARLRLDTSKLLLTTTNLEILAAYRKRQTLLSLLGILKALRSMRSIDQRLQRRLTDADYGGAIAILLENRNLSQRYHQYRCVESLAHKLQDTLLLTEVQLESVLGEVPAEFEPKRYRKLQEAYALLGKQLIAMDALHMNYVSSVHTAAFTVLRQHMDVNVEESKKLTYEQLCECVPVDKYVHCLTALCRAFWGLLVSYHQVRSWHQDQGMAALESAELTTAHHQEEYIRQKLDSGQFRLWHDMQGKVCAFLGTGRLHALKYDQFVQVLAIVQRLKRVGHEFCDSASERLLGAMHRQSREFFRRYHAACLEEIGLFFDHEVWVPIGSFHDVTQLQEYRNFRHALVRHAKAAAAASNATGTAIEQQKPPAAGMVTNVPEPDSASSMHSQDESSLYGSCGYFLRFTEKSSPFDGGFDSTMLEEDILAGIADESSYYYSEDSSDTNEPTAVPPVDRSPTIVAPEMSASVVVVNTSLTVLRCIGRYLYFCKLLHPIAPHIVRSMTELIDYYIHAVHELFASDLPVSRDNLYSGRLRQALQRIATELVPKLRRTAPLSDEMIRLDLADPESLYGLQKRAIAAESCLTLVAQVRQMEAYLSALLVQHGPTEGVGMDADGWNQHCLRDYLASTSDYVPDLRKPIFMCSTARVIDLPAVLHAMAKVKWDVNHVNVQHSPYIDIINRGIQYFAMKLEDEATPTLLPRDALWDSFVHVLTHLLVEGFAAAKKCSAGGRALMQLDFTHFWSLLEIVSGGKHTEHRTYVEQYVKAYYLPKDLLEQWLLEAHGYSPRQLSGLVACACSSDKKTRQRLLTLIEGQSNVTNGSSSPSPA
ncbi:syndetin [Anopheles darlingi]|uniref:syndetin n=1 Tax=Anopheles darlingi TaxID=43151 RepID=UPI0020FFFD73|nr:syndetin [Anopheles darlingi]